MSLQRRINRRAATTRPPEHVYQSRLAGTVREGSENNPDKGHKDGSCNRTACQRPLAMETEHQFMEPPFTAGERLYYCAYCALDFDRIDIRNRETGASTLPNRITRERKCEAVEG